MENTLAQIKKEKLISIIRSEDVSQIKKTVKALYDGGIRIIEITMNTPNALHAIESIRLDFPDILVGAGTVLDEQTARLAILSGANFLLAPTLNQATIESANRYNIPIIPGVFTPTEVLQALEWGAPVVKIFPISSVGPQYIKDLKGPLNHIDIIPVGGINLQNSRSFIDAGSFALGIGSSLVNDKLVNDGNFIEITNRAREFVKIVQL